MTERSCLPGKGLLREVGGQLRMTKELGNLDTLVERTVRAVAFDLLLGGDTRRTLVADLCGIDGERRSGRDHESQGQGDDHNRTGSE